MLKVVYSRSCQKVTMVGHAGAGPYGNDLVCASASILAYTLAENVAQMVESGQAVNPVLRMEPGNTVIKADFPEKYRPVGLLIFDALFSGYQLLAAQYPNNVECVIQ